MGILANGHINNYIESNYIHNNPKAKETSEAYLPIGGGGEEGVRVSTASAEKN
jgi:hypothetical protein